MYPMGTGLYGHFGFEAHLQLKGYTLGMSGLKMKDIYILKS